MNQRKEADGPHTSPTLPLDPARCVNCNKGLHDLDCKGAMLDLYTLTWVSCNCYCTRAMEVPC